MVVLPSTYEGLPLVFGRSNAAGDSRGREHRREARVRLGEENPDVYYHRGARIGKIFEAGREKPWSGEFAPVKSTARASIAGPNPVMDSSLCPEGVAATLCSRPEIYFVDHASSTTLAIL